MPISREEVQHVAHLARLGLEEHELDRMTEQLDHILSAVDALKQLDTSAIPPTAQVIPVRNVMRDDVSRPSWPRDAILRNAPRTRDNYVFVPPVLEE
jgi:aspartyl-tRNA(Asn)/glutamyl-tRNA(Gln) amidotransferase subunit C